jgi:hypothetical protein
MGLLDTLLTFAKDFRDLVLQPLALFTFGTLALLLLILPKSALLWLGLSSLNEHHRGKISATILVLFALCFIRTMNVHIFPWRKRRTERKKRRESFQRQLDTLSIYELSIIL